MTALRVFGAKPKGSSYLEKTRTTDGTRILKPAIVPQNVIVKT